MQVRVVLVMDKIEIIIIIRIVNIIIYNLINNNIFIVTHIDTRQIENISLRC